MCCNNYVIFFVYLSQIKSNMRIDELLNKPSWRRRLPPTVVPRRRAGYAKNKPMRIDNGSFMELTQSDFLDEKYPTSHLINSLAYRSPRKKYKYNTATKQNEENGYEELSVVALPIQQGILRHKRTCTFGNEMWFGSESKDSLGDELVSMYRSHWNMAGMTDALNVWGEAFMGTGDSAIYLYRDEDHIRYKVFSYEKGDVLTEKRDENGKRMVIRMFLYDGKQAVEIYGAKTIQFWLKNNDTPDSTNKPISEDGYTLMSDIPHGGTRCPAIYWREDDVVWGMGQSIIEHIESLLSDLSENNKYYAYQILFLSGGVMNLPPAGLMGKVIASKDKDGKAQILAPADASNTFTLDYEKNMDMLWECTGTTIVDPKELKAGENTGAFIKNLYWREVQWSINKIAELRPAFNEIIAVFADLVGKIEEKTLEFGKLRMSYLLEPYVPKNITEEITNICAAKNSGITSVKTATGEIPFNNPREYEIIKQEQKEMEAKEATAAEKNILPPEADPLQSLDNKAK